MSEKVYKTLAVQKSKEGTEIYTYLDKHCLNYGQNWEKDFIHRLINLKLIALLVSNKVLMFLKLWQSISVESDCDVAGTGRNCNQFPQNPRQYPC
jgi:hypothetical protein